jgi:hypothetical protein
MRHVTGFFLGLVMAALLYAGVGWAAGRVSSLLARGASLTTGPGVTAVSVLAAAGLLLGILLVVPAISPLAAGLPGLALLAWSAYLAVSPRQAERLIPLSAAHGAEVGFRTLLVTGIVALLGAAMVIPLFVPSRWRAGGRRDDDGLWGGPPSETGLLQ